MIPPRPEDKRVGLLGLAFAVLFLFALVLGIVKATNNMFASHKQTEHEASAGDTGHPPTGGAPAPTDVASAPAQPAPGATPHGEPSPATPPSATGRQPAAPAPTGTRPVAPPTAARGARADSPAAGAAPRPAAGGSSGTPQMIALGDSIFHGRVAGGTCQTCHGPDAKGTQIGPDLTDRQWLHGDGSQASIVAVITKGVPQAKQFPGAMPPMGGAQLTPEQVRAVAAYVLSLSRR